MKRKCTFHDGAKVPACDRRLMLMKNGLEFIHSQQLFHAEKHPAQNQNGTL